VAKLKECNSKLLIYGHLWVVGIIVEDRIVFKDLDKVIKASRVNSEIGTKDCRLAEFVIMKEEVKLCAVLVDFPLCVEVTL
jgi:hypothetical protein